MKGYIYKVFLELHGSNHAIVLCSFLQKPFSIRVFWLWKVPKIISLSRKLQVLAVL